MAPPSSVTHPAVLLRHMVTALAGPLVDLLAAPRGVELPLDGVVIVEPDEPDDLDDTAPVRPGALVLVIGVRGRAALRPLLAAGRAGAVAVALRTGPDAAAAEALRRAAAECGTALLGVREEARWEQVAGVARTLLDMAPPAAGFTEQQAHGDLLTLVQTLATLTGGIISIEDAAGRVLAYSRSDDQVDEVRRMSILGHACPEDYLAFLRASGVYARLRAGEEVLDVPERADLGARRRTAAGIMAGGRLLGTVWIQEGTVPLAARTPEVLRGAARLAAVHLVRRPRDPALDTALREEFAAGLLAGRGAAGSLAACLGVAPDSPATVVGVDLRDGPDDSAAPALAPALRRSRAAEIASVHAAAYRRTAVAAQLDGRLYVLLPEGDHDPRPAADPALLAWTSDLVTTLRTHLAPGAQAAVTARVPRLAEAPKARDTADRMLAVLARSPDRGVASYPELRAAVVLGEVLELLDEHPGIHDPALDVLTAYDHKHGADLAASLLLYLDAFGDVSRVAERLHIHPNTLRHRVRRAVELTGIDLDDPEQRLVAMLQLRRTVAG